MCLNSSGLFGLVPCPTCSHGESESKFLRANNDMCTRERLDDHT